MQIFESWRGGAKWERGRWKWRFSLLSFTVFRTFYIRGHTTSFTWCDCRWPWRNFKVIRLFHIKFLKNGAWYTAKVIRPYRPLIANHTLAFDWCHFDTLNDIWRSFHLPKSYISEIIQDTSTDTEFVDNKSNICFQLIRMSMTLAMVKVIKLFHIKFLVNSTLYRKSYYRVLIGNHTLAFDWCHFWWPRSTFLKVISA